MSPKRKHPSAAFQAEAARWLAFGRGDLESALALLATATPNRNVGYLAQQAAEKALKAVILLEAAPFEMTHDLTAVAAQLPPSFAQPVTTAELAWLADLETSGRYPNEGDTVTHDDAGKAVELAHLVLSAAGARFASVGIGEGRLEPE